MIIRPFEPGDFGDVLEIEAEAFAEHNPFIYMNFYEMNSDSFLVAEEKGRITGFVVGYQVSGEEGRIFSLAVKERYRGYGIGTHLLEAVISVFRKKLLSIASLEVRLSNREAQRLYQKTGFVPCWIHSGYYSDGEDGIIMKMRLYPVVSTAVDELLSKIQGSAIMPAYRLEDII
ncbi:ribosomal protein S18-alanine N-acetyltransferase [Methanolobus chelungpuianus]|uniref:GNAT family acetyltransferase n=1 Tax=Methanolobus chelungpuianus TaxID=502115 RepID=A0AAE3HCQ7_9EURY|nr:ribosomal protein S18-alanine N-acetyltransferase [Methanolobus chelungpuianus]MCQ6963871.1 GNAT family acetyltransferase [Methanolobus chelungpuianus]